MSITTDAQGRFVFTTLYTRGRLSVKVPGYFPYEVQVYPSTAQRPIEIQLAGPAQHLRLQFVTDSGKPTGVCQVRVLASGSSYWREYTTDEHGELVLERRTPEQAFLYEAQGPGGGFAAGTLKSNEITDDRVQVRLLPAEDPDVFSVKFQNVEGNTGTVWMRGTPERRSLNGWLSMRGPRDYLEYIYETKLGKRAVTEKFPRRAGPHHVTLHDSHLVVLPPKNQGYELEPEVPVWHGRVLLGRRVNADWEFVEPFVYNSVAEQYDHGPRGKAALFFGVAAGRWTLFSIDDDARLHEREVDLAARETIELMLPSRGDIPKPVTGYVESDERPVVNATVSALCWEIGDGDHARRFGRATTRTDPTGRFTLPCLGGELALFDIAKTDYQSRGALCDARGPATQGIVGIGSFELRRMKRDTPRDRTQGISLHANPQSLFVNEVAGWSVYRGVFEPMDEIIDVKGYRRPELSIELFKALIDDGKPHPVHLRRGGKLIQLALPE